MTASPEAKLAKEKVLWVKHRTPKLMTFTIGRPKFCRFSAGQFSHLGFRDSEGFIWRAYSVISAECTDTLEYFAVLVGDGPMSARFVTMKEGDTILLDRTVTGFLLPERFPNNKDLVMLYMGSGTMLLLSITEQPEIWWRLDRLVLAHSVSYAGELILSQRLTGLKEHPLTEEYFHKFTFVSVTMHKEAEGALDGKRVPGLLKNSSLETKAGFKFIRADMRSMVCDNPTMVRDIFQTLMDLGYTMHRSRIPGEAIMENGF